MTKKISEHKLDPREAQIRFEAEFYGDWYSKSLLESFLCEKKSSARQKSGRNKIKTPYSSMKKRSH
tara:strand:+ start:318 stop:515 length:198 start_codon:yes stop_codon:yes gene_type:complete